MKISCRTKSVGSISVILAHFLFCTTSAHADVGFRELVIGADAKIIDQKCETNDGNTWKCLGETDLTFSFRTAAIMSEQDVCGLTVDFSNVLSNGNSVSGEGFILCEARRRNLSCSGKTLNSFVSEHSPKYDGFSFASFCETYDRRVARIESGEPIQDDNALLEQVQYASELMSSSEVALCSDLIACAPSQTGDKIDWVRVNVGTVYQRLSDIILQAEDSPQVALKKQLSEKYGLDWEFTERQTVLFNDGERNELFTSFGGGRVFMVIERTADRRIIMAVEYFNAEQGAKLLKEREPRELTPTDF